MKITFAVYGYSRRPGGGLRVIYRYANGLAERGHEVTVVHSAAMEPRAYLQPLRWRQREFRTVARAAVDLVGPKPGPPAWADLDPRVDCRFVPTLSSRWVPKADAIVATLWRTAEAVSRYPADRGRKFHFIQHHEVWDGPTPRVEATWRLPLTKIVIAQWLADIARDLDAGPVRVIPNAIDLDRFRVTKPIEGRPPRVAMLWSAAPVKGGSVGLAALERARTRHPDLRAVLFSVQAPPRDLPSWVEFRRDPPQAELVEDVYNGTAVYLCPSFAEGWHLPPAEAMACGCAVVSTAIDGVADYAVDGETALLAPPGDALALGDRLADLLDDDEKRVRLALAGRARISEFSWTRSIDQMEACLAGQDAPSTCTSP